MRPLEEDYALYQKVASEGDWMEALSLLTTTQVAQQLQVRRETVCAWLQTGKLRGLKLPGGDWRIRPHDLDHLLNAVR